MDIDFNCTDKKKFKHSSKVCTAKKRQSCTFGVMREFSSFTVKFKNVKVKCAKVRISNDVIVVTIHVGSNDSERLRFYLIVIIIIFF